MIGALVAQALLGLVLVGFGRWGGGHAQQLAPPTLDPEDREARVRVYRRGSTACMVIGVGFVVLAVGALTVS